MWQVSQVGPTSRERLITENPRSDDAAGLPIFKAHAQSGACGHASGEQHAKRAGGSPGVDVLNRSDPVRLGAFPQLRLAAKLLTAIAIGVALVLIFLPPLQAKFVSDTFVLYERARAQSPSDLVALFVPQPDHWYMPLTDLAFWLEARAFGPDAIGYHVFALTCHIVSTALVFLLTKRLSGSRKAALCAALVFLANPHAQEPLWDVADLHTVLSTPILLASLFSYSTGRRKGAWILTVLALGVDEAGLLAIPMIALYELIVACPTPRWSSVKQSLLRLLPVAIVAVAYLAMRMLAGPIYNEQPVLCRYPKCLAPAFGEYFNRFLVRPDLLLDSLWTERDLRPSWTSGSRGRATSDSTVELARKANTSVRRRVVSCCHQFLRSEPLAVRRRSLRVRARLRSGGAHRRRCCTGGGRVARMVQAKEMGGICRGVHGRCLDRRRGVDVVQPWSALDRRWRASCIDR